MKKIIYIIVILVCGVFTSCTDSSEDIELDQVEQELQNTGGEEDQDPPKKPEED